MLPTRCCQPYMVLQVLSSAASKVSLYVIFLLCILTRRYCVAYSCNNFPICSFRWPHLTLTAYFCSWPARAPSCGTPSRARMDSTWGTFTSAPYSKPSACSASLLTACGDSSLRVCLCPLHQRAPLSSVGLQLFFLSSRQMINMRRSPMSM